MRTFRLLVVNADLVDQMAVARLVRSAALPIDCTWADSVAEAREALADGRYDAALIAEGLEDGTPLDLVSHLGGIPALVLSNFPAAGPAGDGRVTFMLKPTDAECERRLGPALRTLLGIPEPTGALAGPARRDAAAMADPDPGAGPPGTDTRQELYEFVHLITHDLKAPLRGMATLAEMIVAEHGPALGVTGQARLAMLRRRAERLVGLLDRVHEYGVLTRDLRLRAVGLGGVIRDALAALAVPSHVAVEVAPQLPVVWGDRTRLVLLFQHLLDNAVKFLDKPQGTVRVAAAEAPDGWQVSVADNGPGIEACYFDTIFEPCKTLAPQDQVEGSGLGLTLARKVAALHGGRIWVESTLGAGSVFHVVLPRPPGAAA